MSRHTREELAKVRHLAQKAIMKTYGGPVLPQQVASTRDPPARGAQWVSRTTFPAPPESDVRDVLLGVIEELGNGKQKHVVPEIAPVPAQWTAHRAGVGKDEPEPADMSERSKYDALTAESKRDLTIMYMYGGGHCVNGPATRRAVAATLSQLTGARAIIVQHRLAPQHPFPTQQLDILIAYLSLLHPPPGSHHSPIRPSKLVLAGDSSGAQLAASLILTLLSAHRRGIRTVRFHGRAVPLPLPAGIAVQSPHFDQNGRCLPSWRANRSTDFLLDENPSITPAFEFDSVWPASPPRAHFYTETPTLAHPLVSPMTARGRDWEGAPPVWIAIGGGEQVIDAARVTAKTAAGAGVRVVWDEYELMPHNWAMLLRGWPQSSRCFKEWAMAIVGLGEAPGRVRTRGTVFAFDADGEGKRAVREVEVGTLSEYDEEDVRGFAQKGIERLEEQAREVMQMWRSKL